MNFLTQLHIKLTPTLKNWADFGMVEVAKPEDFFSIGYKLATRNTAKIKGVICPIPKDNLPDRVRLSDYYNAIQKHPSYYIDRVAAFTDDVTNGVAFSDSFAYKSQRQLPDDLVALENMLCDAFEKVIDKPAASAYYRINSNHHRRPFVHSPTGIVQLDGPTTIMFRTNARGWITGKKSLPSNAIVIFTGMHAAPDTDVPRLNILCA